MENVIIKMKAKADRHLCKVKEHQAIGADLRMEYNNMDKNNPRRDRVGEQLLTTLESIEYHKGSAKTYNKAIKMIEDELK